MKILSATQIRALDAYTIEHEPIDSINLMERASASFVEWFIQKFPAPLPVKIVCGVGNNGGDGLAIARMLLTEKYIVEVFVVAYSSTHSPDFTHNYHKLAARTTIHFIEQESHIPEISSSDVIIDAIFGSGLSRPVEGIAAAVINVINASKATVVAVDIPSGLYVDTYNPDTHIIQADYTVSFQLPKLSFLLPQNFIYVGEWHLTDIGLHPVAIEAAQTNYFFVDTNFVEERVKRRGKFSHKGTFGHALLIAGSYGKMGAAVLATKACLKSGVGLLTVQVPTCGYQIMQICVPEVMTLTDTSTHFFSQVPLLEKFTTVGIGPGLGTEKVTAEAMADLLKELKRPLIIDADGLNILAANKELLALLPPGSILTPHPKEFERLAGNTIEEYERLEVLQKFTRQYQLIVVLKGAHTAIATPDGQVYFNSTGNPGMATGGTGDVLTGIITSLLAQNYTPTEAATLGVYFHGLAGDYAARQVGYNALTASDVISCLPQAFLQFNL